MARSTPGTDRHLLSPPPPPGTETVICFAPGTDRHLIRPSHHRLPAYRAMVASAYLSPHLPPGAIASCRKMSLGLPGYEAPQPHSRHRPSLRWLGATDASQRFPCSIRPVSRPRIALRISKHKIPPFKSRLYPSFFAPPFLLHQMLRNCCKQPVCVANPRHGWISFPDECCLPNYPPARLCLFSTPPPWERMPG